MASFPALFFSVFRLFLLLLGVLLSAPCPALAFNDLVVGTFVDTGVVALGRGGLKSLPHRPETLDFGSPLYLDSEGKNRIELGYEQQLTARLYRGRWQGSVARSSRLETSAAAPYSLFQGKLRGSIAGGYAFDAVELTVQSDAEKVWAHADQKTEALRAGMYLQLFDRVSLGVSVIDTGYRRTPEIPVELALQPVPWFKAGYRHGYLDFKEDLAVRISGHDGNLPLSFSEQTDTLLGAINLRRVQVTYENELGHLQNRSVEGRLLCADPVYLTAGYRHRDFAPFDQPFSADNSPGGYVKGNLKRDEYRVGFGWDISERWNLEANFRHVELALGAGGLANSAAVAGFWPSLVLGNYNYVASAGLTANQYHIGSSFRGERFSFSLGGQYLDVKPGALLDYWRTILFGLGRADQNSNRLSVDRIGLVFLSAGLGYRWQNVEISYAVGQFIPVYEHDTTPSAAPATSSSGGGGSAGNAFSHAWDKIIHYPGGGLQRILLKISL